VQEEVDMVAEDIVVEAVVQGVPSRPFWGWEIVNRR
jgi:hypothetical protein